MKKNVVLTIAFFTLLFVSCDKDDNPTTDKETVKVENEVNAFVWKGLNKHYYWQSDVPNLADSKKDDINAFNTYLNGQSNSEDFFKTLLYKYVGNVGKENAVDRFSWFIEDYKDQEASFRGVSDAFGFEFDLARVTDDGNDVIGYVTYVVPNSPASEAGMKRGDIFNVFDGVTLDLDNYKIVNNYYRESSISMKFATISAGGNIVSNGKEATLNLRKLIENPVHHSSIINAGDKKVGYLVYNGFKYTFHDELNAIFGEFKSAGIQELVLDLRYNGGGSVLTSAYLASMIHAGASENDVFGKLVYNSKNSDENGAYSFFNKANIYNQEGKKSGEVSINRLSTLSRIYVITSGSTASASEMIINGLSPYMDVITVGTTTYGKNVGSFTVYDSPDFGATGANPNHTNAMQPITFMIFNKLDQSEYTHGFAPDHEQKEFISDMKAFGNPQEPLLKIALGHIAGIIPRPQDVKNLKLQTEHIFSSFDMKPFSKEMYIIPSELSPK